MTAVKLEVDDANKGFFCGEVWCKSMASDPAVEGAQDSSKVQENGVEEKMQSLKIAEKKAPVEVTEKKDPVEVTEKKAPVEVTEKKAPVELTEQTAPAVKEVPVLEINPSETLSSITSVDTASSKGSELGPEALLDHSTYNQPNDVVNVYYPGYELVANEWNDQALVSQIDGVDMAAYQSIPAENGMVYYLPGYGYPQTTYSPFNPYVPSPVFDGLYAHQQYYGAPPLFQQPLTPPAYFQPPVAYGSEIPPAFTWDAVMAVPDRVSSVPPPTKTGQTLHSSNQTAYNKVTSVKKQNTATDTKGTVQPLEAPKSPLLSSNTMTEADNYSAGSLNQDAKFATKQPAANLSKGYAPLGKVFPSNQGKNNGLIALPADSKSNGHDWFGNDRLKVRGKVGSGSFDGLNEQNRGPRINKTKNIWVTSVDGVNGNLTSLEHVEGSLPLVNRDRINLPDFPTKYENALFFVIKSYSEDDVHKSIKYNVWASTPNGNKRLESAYQAAQEKSGGKPGGCPIFLFFSVNASGQFCGVAEMVGSVDFNRSMTFWQQDKWNGYIPLKWHFIKDVPNAHFRHIILENNDNRPVTNSRDTQEISFLKGLEMLNIFKTYSARTSILDDFMFYEQRQKAMQDKRRQNNLEDHFQLGAGRDIPTLGSTDHSAKPDKDARLGTQNDQQTENGNNQSELVNAKASVHKHDDSHVQMTATGNDDVQRAGSVVIDQGV